MKRWTCIFCWLLLLLLLAGCSPVATAPPKASSEGDSPSTGAETDAQAEADAMQIEQTELVFAGNGDTFLAAIENAAQEVGNPESHRFVELTDGNGHLWQGEALQTGDQQIVFLQAAGSGGERAQRFDTPADVMPDAFAELLPAVEQASASSNGPEIHLVRARRTDENVWAFDVTLAYPDTGWEDYADGWHVATTDGAILGTRILLHPHVNEQPFTRSLSGVTIPDGVDEVVVRAHDLVNGYGAETVTVPLGEAGSGPGYEVIR